MTPETVLSLCSYVALAGWALLVFLPKWETGTRLVVPVVAVGALSAVYAALAITKLPGAEGGFGSLADIATLFSDPWILLAGWIHYLAFDLFIGAWEVRNARALGISHWFVIPCLFLTFMLGPVGLLAYLALRGATKRRLAVGMTGALTNA